MTNWVPTPGRSSTPGERNVLVWVIMLVLAGVGGYLIYLGVKAPPEKAELAARAELIGFCLMGTAVAIYIVRWAIRRWLE